jgi:hypothetical protein
LRACSLDLAMYHVVHKADLHQQCFLVAAGSLKSKFDPIGLVAACGRLERNPP